MTFILFLSSIVIFVAILTNKIFVKFGIPALLFFMCLGMLFGVDGIFRIDYSDFIGTKNIASLSLGFIIFYGGLCTKWKAASSVFKESVTLATLGVFLTAVFMALCCHIFLLLGWTESFLIGSVLASIDAASVFSILREKHLNLKENTAPLLEIESGSNDPMSYVLTILAIALLKNQSLGFVSFLFFKQMFLGALTGILMAKFAVAVFQKTKLIVNGNGTLFVMSVLFLTFSLSELYDGNPFLALYLFGIIIGNSAIANKSAMLNFYDGITRLAQIGIFFMLGLLAEPLKALNALSAGWTVFLFLTFIVRPFVVWIILLFFKSSWQQILLTSWAGLRGVASIVFAIIAVNSGLKLEYDLFHLVFFVSIFSVAIQGTLLPYIATKMNMVDESGDIREIFNDFQEECAIKYLSVTVPANHEWVGKKIRDIKFSNDALVLTIHRSNTDFLPQETTMILEGDKVTFAIPAEY